MDHDIKDLLKEEVSIKDVVERLGIPLKAQGNCLVGDCPTGHESEGHKCFGVNLRENYYHCFHCGEAGDIFSLVELVKKLEFKGALKWLAQEFRPELLPQMDKYKTEGSPRLKEYYQKADLYRLIFEYGKDLLYKAEGKKALSYLTEVRGYEVENLKQTDWIYYPPAKEIRKHLSSIQPEAKHRIQELKLRGFFGDNFRLAVPYRDRRGAITGFLFRATEPEGITVKANDGETHSGVRWDSTGGTEKHDLFNLHACKGFKELLIVEGYPDALYLPTLGLKNVVAVGQGLLSRTHVEGLLAFGVKQITFSFDNESVKIDEKTGEMIYPGVENTEKATDLFKGTGITALIIDPFYLAPHKDPDEFVKAQGIGAFKTLFDNAESWAKWRAKRLLSKYTNQSLQTDRVRNEVWGEALAFEETLRDVMESKDFLDVVTESLNLPDELVELMVRDYHEKKASEREVAGYQVLFRECSNLLEEGKITSIRGLLEERLPELKAKVVSGITEPYTLQALLEDIVRARPGLKTGYESLDKLITIPTGAITIIAGRPSHGKTTLLMNLFLNMIEGNLDKRFFFFSYEESKRQVGLKLINILSGELIDEKHNLIQLENYLKENNTGKQTIEEGKAQFKGLTESGRLWVIDGPYFVDELTDTIALLNERHEIGAVFIDHIQRIKTKGKYPTRQIELQRISDRILETAKAFSLPIILGVQLGSDPNRKDKVSLDNLREGGDIAQDANLVIGLYNEAMQRAQDREETLKDKEVDLKITILKNRNGIANQEVILKFDRPILRIEEKNRQDKSGYGTP